MPIMKPISIFSWRKIYKGHFAFLKGAPISQLREWLSEMKAKSQQGGFGAVGATFRLPLIEHEIRKRMRKESF